MDTTTSKLAQADVDFVWGDDGETLEQALDSIITTYGLTRIEVLKLEGPAGGWPEVRLFASRDRLERCLREAWSMDDDDVATFLVA